LLIEEFFKFMSMALVNLFLNKFSFKIFTGETFLKTIDVEKLLDLIPLSTTFFKLKFPFWAILNLKILNQMKLKNFIVVLNHASY
jgi:hypothetical protein